jgi:hypothetical protein
MKWMFGVLAWLAFLVVVGGCSSDVPQAVVITKPIASHLCHIDEPPLYPGCDCPPACPPGTTKSLVVTYAESTPVDTGGVPLILPYYTSHTDETGHIREPKPQYLGHDWDSTMTITVEYDTNGHPAPSSQVTVAIFSVDSGGLGSDSVYGHHHQSSAHPKPKGHLFNSAGSTSDPLVLTTNGAGKAVVVYKADSVSGPIHLIVSAPSVDSVTRNFNVGVPYLVPVSGTHVRFETTSTAHPNPHYALASFIVALDSVADVMADSFPASGGLVISDLSLAYGGFLDLDSHWGADSGAHIEHRLGRSADVDSLSTPQRSVLRMLWESAKDRRFVHKEASHYHLRFWKAG